MDGDLTFSSYLKMTSSAASATAEITKFLIDTIVKLLIRTAQDGNKVICCSNGGLSAISSHFVAELVGRFEISSRNAIPALSLSSDTSIVTAISNDYGFSKLFSRQLRAFGNKDDAVILMSCSGKSQNIIEAYNVCTDIGLRTIMLTGKLEKELVFNEQDIHLNIESNKCSVIQEVILQLLHYICYRVDAALQTNHV